MRLGIASMSVPQNLAEPTSRKLLDEDGGPLYASGAPKRTSYRYYVSRSLVKGSADLRNAGRARSHRI